MSNSRSERRRQSRGGSTPPPRRRDPMLALYIVGGIVVLLIVAAVVFVKWQQTTTEADIRATPTPNAATAGATSKPIQLADGETLGVPMIEGGIAKGLPDTKSGGLGQPVDGMTCGGMEYQTLHIHIHLAIFYHGKQVQVPAHIGFGPVGNGQACLYWTHTHAPDGIIHVESPVLAPPGSGGFILGMVFDVWGQPLTRTDVAGLKGPVICYVNGVRYDGDLRQIPLSERKQIVLEIGSPTVPPPNYAFPPLD